MGTKTFIAAFCIAGVSALFFIYSLKTEHTGWFIIGAGGILGALFIAVAGHKKSPQEIRHEERRQRIYDDERAREKARQDERQRRRDGW